MQGGQRPRQHPALIHSQCLKNWQTPLAQYSVGRVAQIWIGADTLAVAAAKRGTTAGEAANAGVTVALGAAALKSATTPFWSGLALGRMADALGESAGIKGAFNTALTGDPRGICPSRCEDWKKVKQSAYAFATLTSTDAKQDMRVLATAFSETLAPEEVVGEALSKIQSSIDVRAEATKTP